MREKVLIQPIKFRGPVECDACFTNIYMKSIDYVVAELGWAGEIIECDVITKQEGVCPKCGKHFDLEKDGLHFRIKDRAPERYKSREEHSSNLYINLRDEEESDNPFIKKEE